MNVKYNTYRKIPMEQIEVAEDDHVVTVIIDDVIKIEPSAWINAVAINIPDGFNIQTRTENGKTRILISNKGKN